MLVALAFAAQLAISADSDWTTRKRLLRERLAAVVVAGNTLHARDDETPQLTLDRLPGRHGTYNHTWNVMTLDLESVHDQAKFWHVYNETIAHEWAHHLNAAIHRSRGHDETFHRLLEALKREVRFHHDAARGADDVLDTKTRR